MQFEEALTELETINDRLERNQVPLEEAIELYERGMKLIDHCKNRLDKARGDIKKLTDDEEVPVDNLDI